MHQPPSPASKREPSLPADSSPWLLSTRELADIAHWIDASMSALMREGEPSLQALRSALAALLVEVATVRAAELASGAAHPASKAGSRGVRDLKNLREAIDAAIDVVRRLEHPTPNVVAKLRGGLALLRARLVEGSTSERLNPERIHQPYHGMYVDAEGGWPTAKPSPQPSTHLAFDAVPNLARLGWREMNQGEHFVQIYEREATLLTSLTEYVADGLWRGERVVVIATDPHRRELESRLRECGLDLASSIINRTLILHRAEETLPRIDLSREINARAFDEIIGGIVRQAAASGRPVRAFGELVAMLCVAGRHAAALELERLWNRLANEVTFTLYCAYPADVFTPEAADTFNEVCRCHGRVIPVESYANRR